jgi:hypothetical protein
VSNKPVPKFTVEDYVAKLHRERGIYDGPYAFTAMEIVAADEGISKYSAYKLARQDVKAGKLVETQVRRQNSSGMWHPVTAWVDREVYDWWQNLSQIERLEFWDNFGKSP